MSYQDFLTIVEATNAPTVAVLLVITHWMKNELTEQRAFYERIIRGLLGFNGNGGDEG